MINQTNKNIEQKEVLIHALSHDGRGIATVGNITTFINGGLPGDKVTYKIIKKHRQYYEALLLDVIEKSNQRITPPCKHFNLCGGCSLQHMNMETQLTHKQHTLFEQLKHFGKVEPEKILAPLCSLEVGYRRKARLGVKFVYKKNKILVGFREKASHYLADLEECMTLHPLVGKRLIKLNQLISSLEIYQHIPQIEVAIGDEEAALIFRHLLPISKSDQDKLVEFGQNEHFQIYLQPNSPLPINKLWPQDNKHRLSYTIPEYQLEFLFHPLDFTQINLEINRQMVKQAINLLDLRANETVLDLFCGIGNFTLPIAREVKEIIGVEGSIEMVARAFENAEHNQIQNVNFYAANLENPGLDCTWIKTEYDKILLDPPRTGAKAILPFIAKMNAKKIVYISCNPATLARDAGVLVHEYKYCLKEAGIMNMFPHTSHVEAIAVFDKIER